MNPRKCLLARLQARDKSPAPYYSSVIDNESTDLEALKPGETGRAEIHKVARVIVTVETLKRIVNLLEQEKGRLIDP